MKHTFYWLWTFWVLYFGVIEGYAVWWEWRHRGNDTLTFTHFIASQIPMSLRVAFLAWLVYHFVWVHING